MGSIEKNVNETDRLTVYTARGAVSDEEIKNAIAHFYEFGPITRNSLWDFSEARTPGFTAEEILNIAQVKRKSLELRKGGRTAIVAPTDLSYGLSRMFLFNSPLEELPFEIKIFREFEHAIHWLSEAEKETN